MSCPPLLVAIALAALAARADDGSVARWRTADARTQAVALGLARRAFDAFARDRAPVAPPKYLPPLLRERAAVFVSAMRHGAPRCCMGTLYPMEQDAAHEIVASAMAAAARDRRFPPIKPTELAGLTLIVSIVGSPESITERDLPLLDPARDGLVVRAGDRTGVTLSGETSSVDRMLKWARIRAGAKPGDPIELYRIAVVRFVENDARPVQPSAKPGK